MASPKTVVLAPQRRLEQLRQARSHEVETAAAAPVTVRCACGWFYVGDVSNGHERFVAHRQTHC